MKMKLILGLVACLILNISQAQLSNSTWRSYYSSPVNDSLTHTFSTNQLVNEGYTVGHLNDSEFWESGGLFYIVHQSGPLNCPVADTGVYSYSIVNDTLNYTLVSDDCLGRTILLPGGPYVRVTPNSISEHSINNDIYPNPCSDHFVIRLSQAYPTQIEVRNTFGQIVVRVNTKGNNSLTINTSTLAPGHYSIIIRNQNSYQTKQLVKQ